MLAQWTSGACTRAHAPRIIERDSVALEQRGVWRVRRQACRHCVIAADDMQAQHVSDAACGQACELRRSRLQHRIARSQQGSVEAAAFWQRRCHARVVEQRQQARESLVVAECRRRAGEHVACHAHGTRSVSRAGFVSFPSVHTWVSCWLEQCKLQAHQHTIEQHTVDAVDHGPAAASSNAGLLHRRRVALRILHPDYAAAIAARQVLLP